MLARVLLQFCAPGYAQLFDFQRLTCRKKSQQGGAEKRTLHVAIWCDHLAGTCKYWVNIVALECCDRLVGALDELHLAPESNT